jgi:hypothetical protein
MERLGWLARQISLTGWECKRLALAVCKLLRLSLRRPETLLQLKQGRFERPASRSPSAPDNNCANWRSFGDVMNGVVATDCTLRRLTFNIIAALVCQYCFN